MVKCFPSACTGSGEEGEVGAGNADTQESCSRPSSSSKHIKGLWVRGYRASRELTDGLTLEEDTIEGFTTARKCDFCKEP